MKLYTLKEVSEICRLKLSTVYQHTSKGHLKISGRKTYKWGKTIAYVTEKDLNYYIYHHFFNKKKRKKNVKKVIV